MKTKILILGGTGMLGHALFKKYSAQDDLDAYATVRAEGDTSGWLTSRGKEKWLRGVDALNFDSVRRAISEVVPDVVINCIGIKSSGDDEPLSLISINALFPHQLARLCQERTVRMIHISTDGVFDGKQGMYTEQDAVRIWDVYGMTKYLGEVREPPCLTLRTSIIGHELGGRNGLVEWFLRQNGIVRGFTKAIYSGFPTVELARIISDYIVPFENLSGLYHISSPPISKFELLRLIAQQYGKKIEIQPCGDVILDRSLDSSAFRARTGYFPPSWADMIHAMYADYSNSKGSLYV